MTGWIKEHRIKFIFYLICALLFITGVYNSCKPLQKGTSLEGKVYSVPEESIKFLGDITYVNKEGRRMSKQEIFNEIFDMIEKAEKFILIDMFLINDFQGAVVENYRKLSGELVNELIKKKRKSEEMDIIVITDEINTVFGGYD